MSEAKGVRGRYKTTNWAAYNAALKARGSLTIWLDKDMQWYAPANGRRGRQRVFRRCHPVLPEHQMPVCSALRQSLGLVESLLVWRGWPGGCRTSAPCADARRHCGCNCPISPAPRRDLLVDSTGIKFLGEGEWKRKKHGAEYRRQWRKVHLGIDAHTLEIRAIEVTDNSVGDAPMLPELLGQIPADEAVASVSGDGAYDTKARHAAIAQRGAQAVIPPRKNARP